MGTESGYKSRKGTEFMKFSVNGSYQRFNVTAEFEAENMTDFETAMDSLTSSGFTPANTSPQKITPKATNQLAIDAQAPATNCPIHRKPFKTNSRGFFCSTKLESGEWCNENGKPRQVEAFNQRVEACTPEAKDIPF